jgi:hypothetical protein
VQLVRPETCARAELLSRAHSERAVAMITGLNRGTLRALKIRGWKPCQHTRPVRPMPTDFAIQCRHMTTNELRKHYRTSKRSIGKWRQECGGHRATVSAA